MTKSAVQTYIDNVDAMLNKRHYGAMSQAEKLELSKAWMQGVAIVAAGETIAQGLAVAAQTLGGLINGELTTKEKKVD